MGEGFSRRGDGGDGRGIVDAVGRNKPDVVERIPTEVSEDRSGFQAVSGIGRLVSDAGQRTDRPDEQTTWLLAWKSGRTRSRYATLFLQLRRIGGEDFEAEALAGHAAGVEIDIKILGDGV